MRANIQNSIIQLLPITKIRKVMGISQGLIACMPKTGSTFLKQNLANLNSVKKTSYRYHFYRCEQELEDDHIRKVLLRNLNSDLIAQHHVRCNINTIEKINKYRIKTIVLTRNIKDILISMADHVESNSYVWPMYYLDKPIIEEIKKKKISLLSTLTALCSPWLISFYTSWIKNSCHLNKNYKPLFIDYDDLMVNKLETIKKVADFMNFNYDTKSFENIPIKNNYSPRFNKGIIGRGKKAFEEDKIAKSYLENIYSFYPENIFKNSKNIIS